MFARVFSIAITLVIVRSFVTRRFLQQAFEIIVNTHMYPPSGVQSCNPQEEKSLCEAF